MTLNVTGEVWGGNVVNDPTNPVNLFIPWNWSGWIKPQIDALKHLGANSISMYGALEVVLSGTISQATLNAQWAQFASYCNSIGLSVYPKTSHADQITGHAWTNTQIADYTISTLNTISPLCTVVGVDVIGEANAWNDGGGISTQGVADRIVAIYNLIRAGSALPLTFSNTYEWNSSNARDWQTKISAACDFIDFHPYAANGWATPVVKSDVSYWESTYPGRDLLFGEGGSSQSDSQSQQDAFADGLGSLMNQADQYLRGWYVWAITDQGTTDNLKYGLFDASFIPRANKVQVFQRYAQPLTRLPWRLNAAVLATAILCRAVTSTRPITRRDLMVPSTWL